jgi:hypothetical protein
VSGLAGSGKTTLCATVPNAVIISAESGLLSLRGHDIPVIEVSSIADVHEAYAFINESAEAKGFEWVCLDSISEIAEQVLSHEKKINKDARAAYGELSVQMVDLIKAFRDMPGRNVYMSAKMERIKDEVSGGMLYGPSMPGAKLAQALPYLLDEFFVLRVEKDAEGNPTRALQTTSDFSYTAKDRSGALNMFEPPNLSEIAQKIYSAP